MSTKAPAPTAHTCHGAIFCGAPRRVAERDCPACSPAPPLAEVLSDYMASRQTRIGDATYGQPFTDHEGRPMVTVGYDDGDRFVTYAVPAELLDPAAWAEAHRGRGHDASTTVVAAPGYGTGSYCHTCGTYGPRTGGILTEGDVR